MSALIPTNAGHPVGEQPEVESWSTTADTFAGRVHIEWDSSGSVTPLGQLPFFIEYLLRRARHRRNYVARQTMPNDLAFVSIHADGLSISSA
jgi:hypothetical protein